MKLICLISLATFLEVISKNYYQILGVSEDSSDAEIRRAYRRLALEFHPDKIRRTGEESEEEIEIQKQRFLNIQEAYDIIGSSEKRLRYNLEKHGESLNDDFYDRFKQYPFIIFARTNQISLAFSIKFTKMKVNPIHILIYVDVESVYQGVSGTHRYFRNVVCNTCKGNGGINGTCRKCTLCDGHGHCNHVFHDHLNAYVHVTDTACGRCLGKGCIPDEKCSICSGTGIISEESRLVYDLRPGFPNNLQLVYPQAGHMTSDGRVGDVELTIRYNFPPGWSQAANSLDLHFELLVRLEDLATGWSKTIACVNGKDFEVRIDSNSLVDALENGLTLIGPGYGIIDSTGAVGNLYIEIIPIWENMTFPLWIEILQVSCIEPDNAFFIPLMKLFFTYVDHFPDEKELETLMSSYATFNWEQFRIPINETILEKNILASEDIVVRNR